MSKELTPEEEKMPSGRKKHSKGGRILIPAIFVIVELILFIALALWLNLCNIPDWAYYAIFIGIHLINLLFVVQMLYKFNDPEFSIGWLLALTLLPGGGILLYIIYRQKPLAPGAKNLVDATYRILTTSVKEHPEEDPELKKNNPGGATTLRYLYNTTGLGVHSHNKIEYFSCGEEFFPDFIEKLKEAKEFIFMEFFIIHEGKEWGQIHEVLKQKAAEGVEVRLLYDDFGCISTLPANYDVILRKEGIKAYRFNPVHFFVTGSKNNRSHRKIAVIDHKYGYTGGMNLGDEYANDIVRFGYWKDTMIRIEGSAIENLIGLFLSNYDIRTGKLSKYNHYIGYNYPKFDDEGLICPFGCGPENCNFENNHVRVGEQNYINIIDSANEEVLISSPYLVPSTDLLHAIERASLRGVTVKLIIPGIPDKKVVWLVAKYYAIPLRRNHVQIYFYKPGFNHMKTILADGRNAFVGTINMDFRSLVHHFECGATMVGGPVMEKIKADFETMLSQSEPMPKTYKLTRRQTIACIFLRIFAPLM